MASIVEMVRETRRGELTHILDLARERWSGGPETKGTIDITGPHGVGKTVILDTISHELDQTREALAIELPLEKFLADSGEDERVATRRIIERVGGRVSATRLPGASLAESSYWLALDAKENTKGCNVAVLVDASGRLPWTYLEEVERRVLDNLAAMPNVVTIIAQNERYYPWESPLLRANKQTLSLPPLDEAGVTMQLEQLGQRYVAHTVREIGGGYPENTANLTRDESIPLVEQIAPAILNLLWREGPRKQQLVVQELARKLAVFEGFRRQEIEAVVPEDMSPRAMEDTLFGAGMVAMQEDHYWHLDDALRHLLIADLKYNDPELHRSAHEQAAQVYSRLAEKYPDVSSLPRKMVFHQEQARE